MNTPLTQQPHPTRQRSATSSRPSSQQTHTNNDEALTASPTTRRPVSVSIEDAEMLEDDDALYTQRMPIVVRHYWPVEEQGQGPRPHTPQHTSRTMQRVTPQTVVRYPSPSIRASSQQPHCDAHSGADPHTDPDDTYLCIGDASGHHRQATSSRPLVGYVGVALLA